MLYTRTYGGALNETTCFVYLCTFLFAYDTTTDSVFSIDTAFSITLKNSVFKKDHIFDKTVDGLDNATYAGTDESH